MLHELKVCHVSCCFSYQFQHVQTVLTVWNDEGEQTNRYFFGFFLQNKPDSSTFVWHGDAYYRWTVALMCGTRWTPWTGTVSGFWFSEPCVRCRNDYHFPMYERVNITRRGSEIAAAVFKAWGIMRRKSKDLQWKTRALFASRTWSKERNVNNCVKVLKQGYDRILR